MKGKHEARNSNLETNIKKKSINAQRRDTRPIISNASFRHSGLDPVSSTGQAPESRDFSENLWIPAFAGMTNKIMLILLGAIFLPVANPSPALAHLVTTGMGPVYDGIGHFLLTPEDLVPVLALALYAGLRGAVTGRRTMFLLPLSWFVGGLAGTSFGLSLPFPLPVISILVLGALVASDLNMNAYAVAAVAIGLGLTHGFLNGAALREGPGALGLLGIMTVLFVFVAMASAFVVSLKRPWTRIAVRVAGSWIFTSGLMMVGWIAKGQM